MSNAKIMGAVLPGYQGPFFPSYISELHAEFYSEDSPSFNGPALEMLGYSVPDFVGIERIRTKDGYCWFWSMKFRANAGYVVILFPWGQDSDKAEGTARADRHVALYTEGPCDAESIVRRIITVRRSWALQRKLPQQPAARAG